MSDHRVDDLLKDLDDALAVSPSPETVVKVRSRIADQTSRWSWFSWRIAVLATAGIAIIVIGYLQWIPHTPAPAPKIASATPSQLVPAGLSSAADPMGMTVITLGSTPYRPMM